jgi:hypothetical protein
MRKNHNAYMEGYERIFGNENTNTTPNNYSYELNIPGSRSTLILTQSSLEIPMNIDNEKVLNLDPDIEVERIIEEQRKNSNRGRFSGRKGFSKIKSRIMPSPGTTRLT